MTGAGRYVEVQGTGESATFSDGELRALLALARSGIRRILGAQRRMLGGSGLLPMPPESAKDGGEGTAPA
jgi:ribonuclease PH